MSPTIDPRNRRTPDLSPDDLAKREKRRIARANRETPDAYAARVLRELETMQERTEDADY